MRGLFIAMSATAIIIAVGPVYAKSDADFLQDAIKGDNSEMLLGTLAMERGNTEGVRSFGQTLVTDHSKAKEDALAVAKQTGVEPPTDIMDEAKQELVKLLDLKGADFDKEFASYMVDDHKKDVSDFEEQAKSGSSDVAELAKRTLPVLQKHLELAQKLSGAD